MLLCRLLLGVRCAWLSAAAASRARLATEMDFRGCVLHRNELCVRRLACSFCMAAGDRFLAFALRAIQGGGAAYATRTRPREGREGSQGCKAEPARRRGGQHSQKQCQTMPNNAANKTCSGAPRRAMATPALARARVAAPGKSATLGDRGMRARGLPGGPMDARKPGWE